VFLRKKEEGQITYQGRYRDKASPFFLWDHDKGAAGTSSSSDGTTTGRPYRNATAGAGNSSSSGGTSSSDGRMIEGPCGAGTSSSSDRTVRGEPTGILPLAGIHEGSTGPH
jgi:hypothetical protein